MSDDPNERSAEETEQGDGSARADTEGKMEATPAAERKAQEMDVDLAGVEGTGSGGRVTAQDVENAQRQSDSAARSIVATSGPVVVEPKTSRDAILEQYVVLKATLAGPIEGRIDASTNEQITLDDGSKTTVVVKNADGTVTKINFPANPPNFFAPCPPIVDWNLPAPQLLIPATAVLGGTKQLCGKEECFPEIFT